MRLLSVLAALCLAILADPVYTATFHVDSGTDTHDVTPGDGVAADHLNPDSSHCTLRAALEESNALVGADTILIPASVGTIRLTLGSLIVRDNGTLIAGEDGRPRLDAVANPINQATFIIESDSNAVWSLSIRRSRGDALVLFGAFNQIGNDGGKGLILTANGLDNSSSYAIRISGISALGNVIAGNYIGLSSNGITPDGNVNGISLEHGAQSNWIGGLTTGARNIISGNAGYGLVITEGATRNRIAGNFIGPDSTGNSGPGNQFDGVAVYGEVEDNFIGGDNLTQGNLISANWGSGIVLAGNDVTRNRIDGNLIGANYAGYAALGNLGDGILITDGAHDNQIGGTGTESGNLISGNAGHGLHLSGNLVSGNTVTANWIGLARDGYADIGNGWLNEGDGVAIDNGANANIIGGTTTVLRNVISANYRFGVGLQGAGTRNNLVAGNYIGVNFAGSSSLGNSAGVCISDGAQANTIGGLTSEYRNVISGNRSEDFPYGCGVLILGHGTDYNRVSANIIGLDATGLIARRNGSCGVVIGGGAQFNIVGGDNTTDGNIISGNGLEDPVEGRAAGVHIFGTATAYNRISGNLIGPSVLGKTIVGNRGHGIGVFSGAHHNLIGGDSFQSGNQIIGNEGTGVFLSGSESYGNLIRYNQMKNNDGLGIELRDSAQAGIMPPEITTVGRLWEAGPRLVVGHSAPPGATIDIYEVVSPDPSGAGEGYTYLAYTTSDALGDFDCYLPSAPARPIILTAIAVDADSNSSEFSHNGYSPDATPVEETDDILPIEYSLAQNYPNPFNAGTEITFTLPQKSEVTLAVYNVLGQKVRTLVARLFSTGEHSVAWDGRDDRGAEAASGVYFYRLDCSLGAITRKMLFLK
jgi:hypothetical protein